MFIIKNLFKYLSLFFLLISCSAIDKSLDYFSLKKDEKKLEGKRLDIIRLENDLLVDEDASTAKIRTAFKKSANSKKKNKVLLTNFGKAVA